MTGTGFDITSKPPGKARKKRKGRFAPRGRQAVQDHILDVANLLPPPPYPRDELIEYLHCLQDEFGGLAKGHLTALAELMNLSLAEIYEVASFYHNFEIIDDNAPTRLPLIKVCDSLSCALAGSEKLKSDLKSRFTDEARISHGACMGRCHQAPVVRIEDRYITHATPEKVSQTLTSPDNTAPDHVNIETYMHEEGFSTLIALYEGRLKPQDLINQIKESGHRGLGGAGFPHAIKIQSVLSVPGPRLMAVNADESEPGTFKDRYYLNSDPYRFFEGVLIAAHLVEAEKIYIFLRDEYPETRDILYDALTELELRELTAGREIIIRRGAGAYICGEESAMLESLEGKRALPRHKPPFPSHVGLFGQPTLINNVETLYWLPDIIRQGPNWFKTGGRHDHHGFRTFSLSGHVKKPGIYRTPAGITALELIEEYGGGMTEGHIFKAYLPGGASGGLLPATMADIPLDFGTLETYGCFIGSAAVIILSDQDDMKMVARNLMAFFEDESCGQCTPCRVGTRKSLDLMTEESWDLELLTELGAVMQSASICGLGQAAPNALLSLIKYFEEDMR